MWRVLVSNVNPNAKRLKIELYDCYMVGASNKSKIKVIQHAILSTLQHLDPNLLYIEHSKHWDNFIIGYIKIASFFTIDFIMKIEQTHFLLNCITINIFHTSWQKYRIIFSIKHKFGMLTFQSFKYFRAFVFKLCLKNYLVNFSFQALLWSFFSLEWIILYEITLFFTKHEKLIRIRQRCHK